MEPSEEEYAHVRREKRHAVPAIYQQYIDLKVKSGEKFEQVVLYDFSRTGIRFESTLPLTEGSRAECVISIHRSLSQNVAFGICVKSCRGKEGRSFVIGAEIDTIVDATWFNIFIEVHDFIVRRQGAVY
jgi:hypothetical protein